jgi:GTPase
MVVIKQVKVRTIQCKYKDIKEAKAGMYFCISIKNVNKNEIKKGMVMVSPDKKYNIAVKEFWCFMEILHSNTTMTIGYQPFLHISNIRKPAKIKEIIKLLPTKEQNNDMNDMLYLRTSDKAYVKFEFFNKGEYIKPDMQVIFREGNVKAIGYIVDR